MGITVQDGIEHSELVSDVKALFRVNGWTTANKLAEVDFTAIKPGRGCIDVICHVRKGERYCLSKPQADNVSGWLGQCWVVYSTPERDEYMCAMAKSLMRQRLNVPKLPNFPYYALEFGDHCLFDIGVLLR